MKPLNVLSLFDGMSCGRLALERAGIPVANYYASEIDKHAITVSHNNYPDIVRLGDVTLWRDWDIDWTSIDLLLAGSPCQGFSFAGKQLAFDDPRSKLFFDFIDILNHIEDAKDAECLFLLENVRMKKEHFDVISHALDVEPVMINSALVSAQNRVRYYWTNWGFEQPEDKGVVLRDILEFDCDGIAIYASPATMHPASIVGRRLNERGVRDDYNKDVAITQCLEVSEETKSRCLTTAEKDTLVSTLTRGRYPEAYSDELKLYYRKLTVRECERLQTVPDDYTHGISVTQARRMLGNGWTIDVIAHILSTLEEPQT